MTEMNDTRSDNSRRPKAAPIELAGKWVAWDRKRTKIVASGEDFARVREQAIVAGHDMPLMEVVPLPRALPRC